MAQKQKCFSCGSSETKVYDYDLRISCNKCWSEWCLRCGQLRKRIPIVGGLSSYYDCANGCYKKEESKRLHQERKERSKINQKEIGSLKRRGKYGWS
jgi:hypothetical protein